MTAFPDQTFQDVIARPSHTLDMKTRSMLVELDGFGFSFLRANRLQLCLGFRALRPELGSRNRGQALPLLHPGRPPVIRRTRARAHSGSRSDMATNLQEW